MEIALCFILYKPSHIAISRIKKSSESGRMIFVYDNSCLGNELSLSEAKGKIKYYNKNDNIGLSKALDFICNQAINEGFTALLYFDQDTIFDTITLAYVDKVYQNVCSITDYAKSLACISFRDLSIKSKSLNYINTTIINGYLINDVYFTINSGTLFFLNKFSKYTWFDPSFFVDGVDYAFCINSISSGYRIGEIYNVPGINHKDEQEDVKISFLGKPLYGRIYPLKRNLDFLASHLKLLTSSFKIRNFKPKFIILKYIFSYIFFQLVFRVKLKK